MKKNIPFNIQYATVEQKEVFKLLQKALVEALILHFPHSNNPFSMDMNASFYQIAACFLQADNVGVRHQVGFWSSTPQRAEKN